MKVLILQLLPLLTAALRKFNEEFSVSEYNVEREILNIDDALIDLNVNLSNDQLVGEVLTDDNDVESQQSAPTAAPRFKRPYRKPSLFPTPSPTPPKPSPSPIIITPKPTKKPTTSKPTPPPTPPPTKAPKTPKPTTPKPSKPPTTPKPTKNPTPKPISLAPVTTVAPSPDITAVPSFNVGTVTASPTFFTTSDVTGTSRPTWTASSSPTVTATTFPSVSLSPSVTPTEAPSLSPTVSANPSVSMVPTGKPTVTSAPSISLMPTVKPTTSSAPSYTSRSHNLEGSTMRFLGLKPMSSVAVNIWMNVTATHVLDYLDTIDVLDDVSTIIIFIEQDPKYLARRLTGQRKLQKNEAQTENFDETLGIIFTSFVTARGPENFDMAMALQDSFRTSASRNAYIQKLKDANFDIFGSIVAVSTLEVVGLPTDTGNLEEGLDSGDGDDGLGIVIIAGCAGGALLLAASGYYYRRIKLKGSAMVPLMDEASEEASQLDGEKVRGVVRPIQHPSDEELSTLGEPILKVEVDKEPDGSQAGNSVNDESRATGKGSEGSDSFLVTGNNQSRIYGGGQTVLTTPSVSNTAIDEFHMTLFQQKLNTPSTSSPSQIGQSKSYGDQVSCDTSEAEFEILSIVAPAGVLGIVIDSSNIGAPMVHDIRADSVLKDKLQVGDRILKFNEDDVSELSSMQLTKLIGQKSGDERIFEISRTVKGGSVATTRMSNAVAPNNVSSMPILPPMIMDDNDSGEF